MGEAIEAESAKAFDEVKAIGELAVELKRIAGLHQWNQLLEVDRRIADLLQTFSKRPVLNPDTERALEKLRLLHLKTIEFCRNESADIERKMQQHRDNREGLAAYAVISQE